jgi:hypothetical protein
VTRTSQATTAAVRGPRAQARYDLLDYLSKFFYNGKPRELTQQQKKIVLECAGSIHGPVCMFANRLPRDRSGLPSDKLVAGKVVRAIERLARTAGSGGRVWENAWNALTPAAMHVLRSAHRGRPMRMYANVPPPTEIAPVIPDTLKLARQNTKGLEFRDYAVIAILQVYGHAKGERPTPKKTMALIEGIGKIYSKHGLLPPQGLGAISSAKTLHRLIRQATGQPRLG